MHISEGGNRPESLSAYDLALCPVLFILGSPGKVLGIIPKCNLRIPIMESLHAPCRRRLREVQYSVQEKSLGYRKKLSSDLAIVDLLQVLLD
ncbi:hypothetical protein Tco_1010815, partial [Tanacetum coccineum]